ncbi:hypothetical protein K491DRAFT_345387 [Lophiostoma macrostomum CBS 122681]|uniref:Uncharacterized protein n=1 Tax=Lophiostoma macrostomum CBS 122681 TaxID=1314788 RepID=A0A6A6TAY6_9PLEO|nr:hypothetical protein K491DRAFT_345387 [Lophiostoma macrostomum CBS 122681]
MKDFSIGLLATTLQVWGKSLEETNEQRQRGGPVEQSWLGGGAHEGDSEMHCQGRRWVFLALDVVSGWRWRTRAENTTQRHIWRASGRGQQPQDRSPVPFFVFCIMYLEVAPAQCLSQPPRHRLPTQAEPRPYSIQRQIKIRRGWTYRPQPWACPSIIHNTNAAKPDAR